MNQELQNQDEDLLKLISSCSSVDQHDLRTWLQQLTKKPVKKNDHSIELQKLRSKINISVAQVRSRGKRVPKITYQGDLPVVLSKDEIKRRIDEHQVVILCGETGSGKTTQLPKMLLEIGRGTCGQIAHTQPRRIAARSVATRIAKELNSEIGDLVGYQVRFSDRSSPENLIKVMTDGILLAETQTDRYLTRYDTIIIDEAHERNLNVDFLFGYLKRILKKRPDLKLIITSATIDSDKFSFHFDQAPIIEVSGRLYPVEIRYQSPENDGALEDSESLSEAICRVLEGIDAESSGGDVLVFLPGEREIKQSLNLISKIFLSHARRCLWEALPLYSRLGVQEQNKIFIPSDYRRVILATNIAETSLTIPKIQFVIDTGLARVKRYSYRNKVEMLRVEKVSQASANQRSGRSGRVMDGVCVRLYSQEDFEQRMVHEEPEILRSSLATVILRMSALGLDEPEKFPFIDSPIPRALADGYQLLEELGAINRKRRLTSIGKKLSRIPVDPRVARMILASNELGCLSEVLKLAAALSVQDPREREYALHDESTPKNGQKINSDFLSLLSLWSWFQEIFEKKPGKRKLKEICLRHHVSLVRMFEWRELYNQLKSMTIEMGFKVNEHSGRGSHIHRSLLTGLLGNIGFRSDEKGVYYGARGIKFHIHPGSGLRSAKPKWILASELVETSRLYARGVAEIDVDWIEPIAKHLTHSSYHDPRWSKTTGNVVATERVTLYGLVIVPKRQVHYGSINPMEAREIFIRNALVQGEVRKLPPFLKHNIDLLASLESVEVRSRRYDLLVDDSVIFSFFDEKIPEDICNWASFEKWRQQIEKENKRYLFLSKSLLVRKEIESETFDLYPDTIAMNGCEFRLDYRFEPGHILDGVTLKAPIELLNKVDQAKTEWLVPGLIRDKVSRVIKDLPKSIRKKIFPVSQFVDEIVGDLQPRENSLYDLIIRGVNEIHGEEITREIFQDRNLPVHLQMNFMVIDELGVEIESGRDLAALQKNLGVKAAEKFSSQIAGEFNKTGITTWNFGELPKRVEMSHQGKSVVGFPCLKDEKDSVSMILADTEMEAEMVTVGGLKRLFRLTMREQFKFIAKKWIELPRASLQYASLLKEQSVPLGQLSVQERLNEQLLAATSSQALFQGDTLIRSEGDFTDALKKAKPQIVVVAAQINLVVNHILESYSTVLQKLPSNDSQSARIFSQHVNAHLYAMLSPDFIADTPYVYLENFPRYLEAVCCRIDKYRSDPTRDEAWQGQITIFEAQIDKAIELSVSSRQRKSLIEIRWSLEELRVSLWAQQLKTLYPISFKRVERALADALSNA
ncbi:ATP-dependent RNA helicase HrpA [Burkholderiales bacterium]|nr:ATP-dependent RNA helicase HrpA [Burkholderiales bacterium]